MNPRIPLFLLTLQPFRRFNDIILNQRLEHVLVGLVVKHTRNRLDDSGIIRHDITEKWFMCGVRTLRKNAGVDRLNGSQPLYKLRNLIPCIACPAQ